MDKVIDIARSYLGKLVTRGVLYGLTALLGKAGIESAESSDYVTAVATGVGALVSLLAGALIDKWHVGRDTAKTN
jgi:hypothetical protein